MQFEKLMAIAGVTGVVHPIANTCNRVTPLNITTPREAPFQLPGGGGAGLGRREARKLDARTSARHMYNILITIRTYTYNITSNVMCRSAPAVTSARTRTLPRI